MILLATLALAQEPTCPTDVVCLSVDEYDVVYDKLRELEEIEEGVPTVTFKDPLIILTDRSGRILTNGTGDENTNHIHGTLEWGHMSADLLLKPDVKAQKREEPDFGFRLRPKAVASYLILQTDLTFKDPLQAVDAGLDLDFVYAYRFNLSGYLGARSFGADVGMDVFKNSGVVTGAHWTWPSGTSLLEFSPSIGWYFAF